MGACGAIGARVRCVARERKDACTPCLPEPTTLAPANGWSGACSILVFLIRPHAQSGIRGPNGRTGMRVRSDGRVACESNERAAAHAPKRGCVLCGTASWVVGTTTLGRTGSGDVWSDWGACALCRTGEERRVRAVSS